MKTTANKTSHKIAMIIATILFTFIAVSSFADESPSKHRKSNKVYRVQTNNSFRTNISTAYMNSGSGHQAGYAMSVSLGNKRSLLETGLIMNTTTSQFEGAQMNYKFYIMPNNRFSSVYIQASGVYHNNASLKDKVNSQTHDSDFTGDLETFNTIEGYVGIGFQQHIVSNVFIDFSIGLGGYDRTITSDEDNRKSDFKRYSDDTGVGVNVKFTVGYYLW